MQEIFTINNCLFSADIGMGANLSEELKIGAIINNFTFTKMAEL